MGPARGVSLARKSSNIGHVDPDYRAPWVFVASRSTEPASVLEHPCVRPLVTLEDLADVGDRDLVPPSVTTKRGEIQGALAGHEIHRTHDFSRPGPDQTDTAAHGCRGAADFARLLARENQVDPVLPE